MCRCRCRLVVISQLLLALELDVDEGVLERFDAVVIGWDTCLAECVLESGGEIEGLCGLQLDHGCEC